MKMKSFETSTHEVLCTVCNEFEKTHDCKATQTHVNIIPNGVGAHQPLYTAFIWYNENKIQRTGLPSDVIEEAYKKTPEGQNAVKEADRINSLPKERIMKHQQNNNVAEI